MSAESVRGWYSGDCGRGRTSTARWRFVTPLRSARMVARSVKWVANQTTAYGRGWELVRWRSCGEGTGRGPGRTLLDTRASEMAIAMARPSCVLVPLPSSSMMALWSSQYAIEDLMERATDMLRLSMLFRMKAISFISAANVDMFISMLSSAERRAKSW